MNRLFCVSASRALLTLVAALNCCLLAGCGGAPDGKCLVAGSVTWNGQPLEEGVITLIPIDGQFGGEASKIEAGRFSFYARPGKNRVEITASKEVGYSESMRQKVLKQFLPAEFNSEAKGVRNEWHCRLIYNELRQIARGASFIGRSVGIQARCLV